MQANPLSPNKPNLRYYTFQYLPPEPDETVWGVHCVEYPNILGGDHGIEAAEQDGVRNLLSLIFFHRSGEVRGGVPQGRATPHNNMPEGYFEVCIDVTNERVVSFSRHVPGFHKASGFD